MWLRRVVVTSLLHSDPESYLQSVSPHLTAAAARDVLTAAKVIMLHCNRIDHAGACFAIGVSLLRELSKLRTAVDTVTAAEAEAVVATCSTCVACIWHGLSPSLLCISLFAHVPICDCVAAPAPQQQGVPSSMSNLPATSPILALSLQPPCPLAATT